MQACLLEEKDLKQRLLSAKPTPFKSGISLCGLAQEQEWMGKIKTWQMWPWKGDNDIGHKYFIANKLGWVKTHT